MRYWFHGNNQDFLLLHSEMGQAATCREIVASAASRPQQRIHTRRPRDGDNELDQDALAAAQEFLEPAREFFDSFADEASDIWNMVAAPFYKETKEDIDEFVVHEEDEDDDDIDEERHHAEKEERAAHVALMVHDEMAAFERDQHDSELRAQRYERMLGAQGSEEGEESDYDEAVDGEETEEDDVKNGGYFDPPSSSEDDDWEKQHANKRTTKLSPQKRRPSRTVSLSHGRSPAKKKRVEDESSSSSDEFELAASPGENKDDDNEPSPAIPTSSMRKRRVIHDDDDDFD